MSWKNASQQYIFEWSLHNILAICIVSFLSNRHKMNYSKKIVLRLSADSRQRFIISQLFVCCQTKASPNSVNPQCSFSAMSTYITPVKFLISWAHLNHWQPLLCFTSFGIHSVIPWRASGCQSGALHHLPTWICFAWWQLQFHQLPSVLQPNQMSSPPYYFFYFITLVAHSSVLFQLSSLPSKLQNHRWELAEYIMYLSFQRN